MIRKTLTIFSLVGLVMSLGLWGLSYYGVVYRSKIGLCNGLLHCSVRIESPGAPTPFAGFEGPGSQVITINPWIIGADAKHISGAVSAYRWYPILLANRGRRDLAMPIYIITLLFAIVFYFSYLPRRRKRKKLGLCITCGYDLRGSMGTCPECGQEAQA